MRTKELFSYIGIVGYPSYCKALIIYRKLYKWLRSKKYKIIVENEIAQCFNLKNVIIDRLSKIGEIADLIIIVGGDGNILGATRILANYKKKIIGINCGNLGFLADLNLNNVFQKLPEVLNGFFYEEKRFLLKVKINKVGYRLRTANIINEIIFHPGKVAHMIEFEVYIDNRFAFFQRSDGLIVTTPTGSTAYSLSAGGPILIPDLEVISIIPMFSHDLSSRPIVISSFSKIKLKFNKKNINYKLNCDGQIIFSIQCDDEVVIKRSNAEFKFIHPKSYNYFKKLGIKLGLSKHKVSYSEFS